MPSVMGRVIPRLIPYSSQAAFVSIRNRVQIISVFIQNCKCFSEHLNAFRWEFSLPAPPLSKGVCKALPLPQFPNTDFYCFLVPHTKFCYRFQALPGVFSMQDSRACCCYSKIAAHQHATATQRGEISADLLAWQLKRSTRLLPAWLEMKCRGGSKRSAFSNLTAASYTFLFN